MREGEYRYECTVRRSLNLRRGKPTLFLLSGAVAHCAISTLLFRLIERPVGMFEPFAVIGVLRFQPSHTDAQRSAQVCALLEYRGSESLSHSLGDHLID